jgi:hypothetical protein
LNVSFSVGHVQVRLGGISIKGKGCSDL